ncbi:hypothetical protein HDE_10279 [Halotydeus destructor]|nr:hypothetical protein HDE_10279 [Halotydeus destructor]
MDSGIEDKILQFALTVTTLVIGGLFVLFIACYCCIVGNKKITAEKKASKKKSRDGATDSQGNDIESGSLGDDPELARIVRAATATNTNGTRKATVTVRTQQTNVVHSVSPVPQYATQKQPMPMSPKNSIRKFFKPVPPKPMVVLPPQGSLKLNVKPPPPPSLRPLVDLTKITDSGQSQGLSNNFGANLADKSQSPRSPPFSPPGNPGTLGVLRKMTPVTPPMPGPSPTSPASPYSVSPSTTPPLQGPAGTPTPSESASSSPESLQLLKPDQLGQDYTEMELASKEDNSKKNDVQDGGPETEENRTDEEPGQQNKPLSKDAKDKLRQLMSD